MDDTWNERMLQTTMVKSVTNNLMLLRVSALNKQLKTIGITIYHIEFVPFLFVFIVSY